MKSKLSPADRALVESLMTDSVGSRNTVEAVMADLIARLRRALIENARLRDQLRAVASVTRVGRSSRNVD